MSKNGSACPVTFMRIVLCVCLAILPNVARALIDCADPPAPSKFAASSKVIIIATIVEVSMERLAPVRVQPGPRPLKSEVSLLTFSVGSLLKGKASKRLTGRFINCPALQLTPCSFPPLGVGDRVVVALPGRDEVLECTDAIVPEAYQYFAVWLKDLHEILHTQ
jgi:hypothetical protein